MQNQLSLRSLSVQVPLCCLCASAARNKVLLHVNKYEKTMAYAGGLKPPQQQKCNVHFLNLLWLSFKITKLHISADSDGDINTNEISS